MGRSKLDLALRRNRKARSLAEFLGAIGASVDLSARSEDRLLDLEESDAFMMAFLLELERRRATNSLEFSRTTTPARFRADILRAFVGKGDVEFMTLFCHWEHVGAVRLFGHELQFSAVALLDWDGDTIYGGTPTLDAGFLFDKQSSQGRATVIYEATYWPPEANRLSAH